MLKVFVITFGIIASQAACQSNDNASTVMDNYLYRLSNSLEQKTPKITQAATLLIYPSRRKLRVDIPPVKINIVEFLKLSQCDVQRLVGERNSSLGRLSKDSQRFLYDLKFIRLAGRCISWLTLNHQQLDIKDKLVEAVEHKKQFLLSQWFNATFASDEFVALFSLGSRPLTFAEVSLPADQLEQALNNLTTMYGRQFKEAGSIESDFSIIGSSAYIGQLRHSMALITRAIETAKPLLDYRIQQKPLCLNQRPNRQSTIVHTVFIKFYIGEVQPYIAKVHQQAQLLLAQVDQLQQPHKSPEFTRFWDQVYQSESSEWQTFNRQVTEHTSQWQKLLAQCGLGPGQ